ncbi:ectonucleotide pyrophosphatase/phosphodiesterase [Mucilaginibacter yixingensis]|uniref:alkaline phosphatase family protein n=1 Tax=Mucilaginibacter yixingensis TaxID=1295612 RepID=UPI001B8743A5|nr:ectonucleotide pyrophosphatase/phosphodiesterase [Mucilaginibacter yixingensis]
MANSAIAQLDTAQQIVPGRVNSRRQQQKPYVILISADGFRYDYAERYQAKHLLELSKGGISAKYLIPAFPSVTFPNHYTLVTGLYPAHHGIIANDFYDPGTESYYWHKGKSAGETQWYGGTPLWTLAEQQHMLSACFYWVGGEAREKGFGPTYFYHYNEAINMPSRLQVVKNWLDLPPERRPHLITFYFPQVDQKGHKYGPDASETIAAVRLIDSAVYAMTQLVKASRVKNVNFILVSDHGMAKIKNDSPLSIPASIDTSKFIVSGEGTILEVYAKKGQDRYINSTYRTLHKEAHNYKVYLKSNLPASKHYTAKDDRYHRIGDIVITPNYPYAFKMPQYKYIDPGAHGYDPGLVKDMNAIFYAWGPQFKKRLVIPPFENVNVYPVVAKLLGLKVTEKIDGTLAVAHKILKQ